jgi:predicted nucleic acid-binding protein
LTLVVDASVAVKWFFQETGHRSARALFARGEAFTAPSTLLPEVGNVAWKRFQNGEITREEAIRVVQLAPGPFSEIVPVEGLVEQAATIAVDAGHPIHDCLYLALCARQALPLVTADKRLYTLGTDLGLKAEFIR